MSNAQPLAIATREWFLLTLIGHETVAQHDRVSNNHCQQDRPGLKVVFQGFDLTAPESLLELSVISTGTRTFLGWKAFNIDAWSAAQHFAVKLSLKLWVRIDELLKFVLSLKQTYESTWHSILQLNPTGRKKCSGDVRGVHTARVFVERKCWAINQTVLIYVWINQKDGQRLRVSLTRIAVLQVKSWVVGCSCRCFRGSAVGDSPNCITFRRILVSILIWLVGDCWTIDWSSLHSKTIWMSVKSVELCSSLAGNTRDVPFRLVIKAKRFTDSWKWNFSTSHAFLAIEQPQSKATFLRCSGRRATITLTSARWSCRTNLVCTDPSESS